MGCRSRKYFVCCSEGNLSGCAKSCCWDGGGNSGCFKIGSSSGYYCSCSGIIKDSGCTKGC